MAYFNCRVFGVVLNQEGRILLIKRNTQCLMDSAEYCGWEFPGGGLEHGEDPRLCVERECLEETGVIIKAERIYQSRTGTRNGKPLLNIGYICRHVVGAVNLTAEHCDYKWVTPEELSKIEFGPYASADIETFLVTLPQMVQAA